MNEVGSRPELRERISRILAHAARAAQSERIRRLMIQAEREALELSEGPKHAHKLVAALPGHKAGSVNETARRRRALGYAQTQAERDEIERISVEQRVRNDLARETKTTRIEEEA